MLPLCRFNASEDCIQRSGRVLKGLNETPELNVTYPLYYHNSPASASSTSSSPSPVEPSTSVPEAPELYEEPLVKSTVENPPLDVSLPRSTGCASVASKPFLDRGFTYTRSINLYNGVHSSGRKQLCIFIICPLFIYSCTFNDFCYFYSSLLCHFMFQFHFLIRALCLAVFLLFVHRQSRN